MEPEKKERYIRWQNYRINQLSFSINLFLSFAVASLAYVINLKLTNTTIVASPAELDITIYWWAASVVLGTLSTLSRLLDFRYTARKIKNSSECDKYIAKMFGKITWATFWVQTITYVIGGCNFIINVVLF
ncbi:hypothetical protein [Desulfuromonas acetoxidans]|uniref:hypothetical protein n=1 Tax=Desulfuromonas acetoxidans TaxID=891 RepID=UPI00292D8478|nr:hypothetical protein [Desulfuromonas acetoxidans]